MKLKQFNLGVAVITLAVSFLFVSAADALRLAPYVGASFSGAPCKGSAKTGEDYTPLDYMQRYQFKEELHVVEKAHFTPSVEQLVSGNRGTLPSDLDYTIRRWPNHHRALNSISIYVLSNRAKSLPPLVPVECYFQRAINFNPKDSDIYLLYGIFLHKTGYISQALENYEAAKKLAPSDMQIQYNLALLYIDLRRYEEANELAQTIYLANFPLQGLKNRLTEGGHWKTLKSK